jgi:diguanylate cyclase (GGDEF)-like protein
VSTDPQVAGPGATRHTTGAAGPGSPPVPGASPDPRQGADRQDVSGAVTGVLVRLLRRQGGDDLVQQVLDLAGERRAPSVLEDPTSWSSQDEALALFGAAEAVVGDPSLARRVGEEMLRQYDGTSVAQALRSLGSPAELLRNVAGALAKFSTVATMEPLEVADAHAVVQARSRPGFRRSRCLCDLTKGLLSQVPVLFGLVPAEVAESECEAAGGRFCLYSIAWEAGQWSAFVDQRTSLYTTAWRPDSVVEARSELAADDESRLAALRRHVDELGRQLEGVYSTAADLLAADDIDAVLARITARAAHAVNAPKYLLVVRTDPDDGVRRHHHGLTEDEAAQLAAELELPVPDERGGSRLVVEVASARRRYGRLAAVMPDGIQFLADDRRMLGLYANYAAAALDVVTALEEVRRSNATARALLDFSRALAQVTSSDGIAETLADTVVAAVGAEAASVWLWDERIQALRLRARRATDAVGGSITTPGTEREDLAVLRAADSALVDHLRQHHDVVILRRDALPDGALADLFARTSGDTVAVAPMVSGGELIGAVTATYSTARRDTAETGDRRERLLGLADHATTALVNVRLLEQVSHLAWHDALTGLPNRRLLEDRVNQELRRSARSGHPVAICFVDLDRFKQVNDTFGHAVGDELIVQVARRLESTVRAQDTVARLGGDELAVLLPGLGERTTLEQLAHRMLEVLTAPYRIGDRDVRTSASIGVAVAPEHGRTYDELLSAADAAMYRAKGLGRNTFQLWQPGPPDTGRHDAPRTDDPELAVDLAHALERGELFVVYQPFVDLVTDAIVGVEALLRWRHPVRGLVEPGVFVPMAEATEAIVAIDSWVVATACRDLAEWRVPDLRLAVNVSTRDLASSAFVDAVTRSLDDHGIRPDRLEIEVTERVVDDGDAGLAANVERLRQLGVRFALDDFGSGHSTLGRIGSFPVSTLKIDQSFVQVLGPEDASSSLVSAIVAMARDLGVDCVAEGVETGQQHRVLLQRGCTAAQGFFFSPPLEAAEVLPLLRAGTVSGAGGTGRSDERDTATAPLRLRPTPPPRPGTMPPSPGPIPPPPSGTTPPGPIPPPPSGTTPPGTTPPSSPPSTAPSPGTPPPRVSVPGSLVVPAPVAVPAPPMAPSPPS